MDLQHVERARVYMQKLAQGINPLDDSPVPEQELINHVRLSRCFFFVADVLGQVLAEETAAPKRVTKRPFSLPFELRDTFDFSQEPIGITELTRRINDLIDQQEMKKLPTTALTDWLKEVGLLQEQIAADGRSRTMPTERGRSMGICSQERMGQYGAYTAVVYDLPMQRFILDNLDSVTQLEQSRTENSDKPWSLEDDAQLRAMQAAGATTRQMSQSLRRTTSSTRARLRKLGLI